MVIKFYGHACFMIAADDGTTIITDPYDESVGYKIPSEKADIAAVSHDHFDHNAVNLLSGSPETVKSAGEQEAKGIRIKGINSFHDNSGGSQRGKNVIFVMEVDGIKVCHLGDLGHILNEEQVKEIGPVDILLIPVGGTYTLDAKEAKKVCEQLKPRLIIPMHYHTDACSIGIATEDAFLKGFTKVEKASQWQGNKESLPSDQTVLVLEYQK